MFRHNTVMIVGAGASCEAKLPSGDELRVKIVNSLQPSDVSGSFRDARIQNAIKEKSRQLGGNNRWPEFRDTYRAASSVIAMGLPLAPSIDHFLDAHAGNKDIELVGKVSIASTILNAEQTSLLAPPSGASVMLDVNAIQKTWYSGFARTIVQATRRDDLENIFSNLTIISFNYDRCIEYFLFVALQSYFAVDQATSAKALEHLNIIHPYGSVGALPWQRAPVSVPFGGIAEADLLQAANSIKTFTESVESGAVSGIREAVMDAETIIFLGFGYHQQNMNLLTPGAETAARRVFATTGGISAWDKSTAVSLIQNRIGGAKVQIYADTSVCARLFDDYRLRLSQEVVG